jgi:hypothetical protein
VITVTASLWLWHGGKASWHFLTVPAEHAVAIRLQSLTSRGGFGSVKVEATIGDVRWRTSLFPVKETGDYVLPVKADIRRRAGIAAGDDVTVTLDLV